MPTRVLVVEDEPASALHLETRLSFMGYEVAAIVSSGEDAIPQALRLGPDVILMDINLAGELDGVETARRIQAQQDIPIIYLTACDDEETVQRVSLTSPYGYLLKPSSERDLRVTIEIALYKHGVETERKQAEAHRRQLEAQLRQAQKLESIGILAGGIAHDFNNILGTMMGYTELLLTDFHDDPKVHAYLEHIYQAGERAADLVARLLTFSRSQECHTFSPVAVTPVITDTLKMLRQMLPASISIEWELPSECPLILADPTQIQQILMNLCVNAAHAMRLHGGTLRIVVAETENNASFPPVPELSPGRYLQLSVSDTGCGMTPEIAEHIFDPFFTTKEPGEGSGLGLSVVHGIVKMLQGAIRVITQPEQGTTFDLFFPITEQTAISQPQAAHQPGSPADHGRGHILLVEDEPALAKLYTIGLTKTGYRVTLCRNGAEALAAFQTQTDDIDVVFTDQTMPVMTGLDLSQKLLHLKPTLPIILATGYSESLTEQVVTALGIRAFLMKPVKVHKLLQVLQELLAKKHSPA